MPRCLYTSLRTRPLQTLRWEKVMVEGLTSPPGLLSGFCSQVVAVRLIIISPPSILQFGIFHLAIRRNNDCVMKYTYPRILQGALIDHMCIHLSDLLSGDLLKIFI